jgi:hypothetical protein
LILEEKHVIKVTQEELLFNDFKGAELSCLFRNGKRARSSREHDADGRARETAKLFSEIS